MAAAGDFEDDDVFDEYTPHPYQGGYDIAATYGSPLPPSVAICYPVSTPALPAPPQPPPGITSTPPVAEPYYWPDPYDYGEADQRRAEPTYESPEVFRGWPYWVGSEGQVGGGCGGRDYWRQWMRGLDYLFGHSDGYGERRIGVDCHGVPVYANRKGGCEEAVVVEASPPVVGSIGFHDAGDGSVQSNRLSWYSDGREETYEYRLPICNSNDRSPCEQSYNLYGVLDEAAQVQKAICQEVHQEEESRYQKPLSYDEASKIFCQPVYCYNQQFYGLPPSVQVVPGEPVSSHRLEYYENFSSYYDQTEVCILESSKHLYEAQYHAEVPDALEPFKPLCSQNLGYYQAYPGVETPENYDHCPVSGEYWNGGSLFVSSFYPQETQTYEQSHDDELDSFERNWHNLRNWNAPSEALSQISKLVDDSYHVYGSFWPFEDYSSYNI